MVVVYSVNVSETGRCLFILNSISTYYMYNMYKKEHFNLWIKKGHLIFENL